MKYNFDKVIDRKKDRLAYNAKWQGVADRFSNYKVDENRMIAMWIADMDFQCPDEVVEAIVNRAKNGIYGYSSEKANDEFKHETSKWLERHYGWSCPEEAMFFSPGVVPSINVAVQAFTKEGEGVIVQPPVYYPFLEAVENNNRVRVDNSLVYKNGRYEIDFEDLEKKASKESNKLLILCSPHNPAGRVWKKEELIKLLDICKKNQVYVFCDEIHADLIMDNNEFFSCGLLKECYDILTFAHSPSKTFNLGGVAAAIVSAPDSEIYKKLKYAFDRNQLPVDSIFGVIGGTAAYKYGDDYACQVRQYISDNMEFAYQYLETKKSSVKMIKPEGTYLAWLDFNQTGNSEEEIYRKILEEASVAGDLGCWFGDEGRGFVRFNFACPRTLVEEVLKRLCDVFDKEQG